MKVLFAVSNENISESIVKKYQKEYKEIISYKNVYYFNAILKEIQKDKSYDRIIISEDLEPFASNNYEAIDKFLFEKLDSISDEAINISGNDTPIILICTDRRSKSEDILLKLFSIGVYNAIIGNDRSLDEICKLIKNPRNKKEAKNYYKIDSESAGYKNESENDVSESEIQNILAHYKRLGKNEEKYIESFDRIAEQYNDEQLKIISSFLPLNVKAVLEASSPKYQQVVTSMGANYKPAAKEKKKTELSGVRVDFLESKTGKLNKPVVIPKAVNTTKVKRVGVKPKTTEVTKTEPTRTDNTVKAKTLNNQIEETTQKTNQEEVAPKKRGRGRPPKKKPVEEVATTPVQEETPKKRGRGRPPKKKPVEEEVIEEELIPGFNSGKTVNTDFNKKNKIDDEDSTILPGMYDNDDDDDDLNVLPGMSDDDDDDDDLNILPGMSDDDDDDDDLNILPGMSNDEDEYEDDDEEDLSILPGIEDDGEENFVNPNYNLTSNPVRKQEERPIQPKPSFGGFNSTESKEIANKKVDYNATGAVDSLITKDKKIVTFVGTSKNGTSFLVNNLAELLSQNGINVAILDTTQNKNAFYIYTKNEEEIRQIAADSIPKLKSGIAEGIKVNKNLSVYTAVPNTEIGIEDYDSILATLVKNHSLVLIDCDFQTNLGYFAKSQETYLVQSMDVLTIQPLTAFLRELKAKNILKEEKLRVVINKETRVRSLTVKTIIGGMSNYTDPAMAFMTELFSREIIKYCEIPFEEQTYSKYLEGLVNCKISLNGYSKDFMQELKRLGDMVYPVLDSKQGYKPDYGNRNTKFSASMNSTLDQMKKNY